MTIGLSDRGYAATGVERTVKLVRGEVTRVELPLPVVTHWCGEVVSAKDGHAIDNAGMKWNSCWWPQEPEPVRDGRIELRLAKDTGITISADGFVARSFAQPEANGVYRLTPARPLRLAIVDANHVAIACTGSLWDASGQEYGAQGDQAGSELQFAGVPDLALTAKLHRGDEVREFAVPAGVTSCTVQWQ